MGQRPASVEERVLVLAPIGADASNTIAMLHGGGFEGFVCRTLAEVCDMAREGAGAVLLAEESLRTTEFPLLVTLLQEQPSWSDLPIIVITIGGDNTQHSIRAYTAFGPTAHLSLIERPLRAITLFSAIRTALRSRRRQYEVRSLLHQLEDKVSERTLRLEQSISELEAFSYSVSHDLRAPLRAMRGYAEVLLEDHVSGLNEEGQLYLRRIWAASERLDRLTQDVLRYSRCARDVIELEPVNLEMLIKEVTGEYPLLNAPHAEITVQRPLGFVIGHNASLTQVFSNLLNNAVKFVPRGTTPQVKVWSEPRLTKTRIFFKDNGIGIPEAHHKKIFKMFERLTSANEYEGTGIGLAIVAKAVERMGGSVGVESKHGEGSTFWIELPTAQSQT